MKDCGKVKEKLFEFGVFEILKDKFWELVGIEKENKVIV